MLAANFASRLGDVFVSAVPANSHVPNPWLLATTPRKEKEMPFGLDLKSLIVGILLAWFVIPWIQGLFAPRVPATSQA